MSEEQKEPDLEVVLDQEQADQGRQEVASGGQPAATEKNVE